MREVQELEDKSNKLRALIEKRKVGLGIEALAASFEAFRLRKRYEYWGALTATIVFSGCSIAVPLMFLFFDIFPDQKTMVDLLKSFVPGVGIEILLVYFIRLSFFQFKSVQAQLLQIDLRIASTNFIRDYAAFKKESGAENLDRFEKLIFSGVVADHEKTPSTFDGLSDIASIISSHAKNKF